MQFFLRSTQPAFWPAAPLRRTSVLPQAKPWRRANSLRPSISITEGWSDQRERNPKENATCRNKSHFLLVDSKGIEPSTSAMRKLIRTFFALFLIVCDDFYSVSLSFRHSLALWSPCATPPSVVRPVVKNAPCPLPKMVSRLGRRAFFESLTACIVTLRKVLSKSFFHRPCLRNWGAVNKARIIPRSSIKTDRLSAISCKTQK